MTTLRWGILSTATIGVQKVIPAIQRADRCEVAAIASRDGGRARAVADDLDIPTAYGSYEELLEDDALDAIYVPLPNDLHAPWTIAALEAGKHVLCEKPLALDVAEAQTMVDAAEAAGVRLAEAFMYRHHPTWVDAVRLVREGAIGELRAVQSWFSYFNDDPDNIRNRPEHGGGALMDIGCYCINLSRWLFDGEPDEIHALVERDPAMGVDVVTSALLGFPGGGQASFTCSMRTEPDQRVHLVGERGRIDIEIPFNIPPDRPTRIHVTAGGDPPVAPATEVRTYAPADAYTLQAEAFARAVLDGTELPVPLADALANQRVIDAILGRG
jgi:predicted dehydrogenase